MSIKKTTSSLTTRKSVTTTDLSGVVVSAVRVTDSGFTALDDTALPASGGYIRLDGTGFKPGCVVYFNNSAVTTTYISSTRVGAVIPAANVGSYSVMVFNTDNSGAVFLNLSFSPFPSFTTNAGSIGSFYETLNVSANVNATSDSAVTYSLYSGTLPPNATIAANGLISGYTTATATQTTYSFVVAADDAQLQTSTRSFSITINPDVVTFASPANASTQSYLANSAVSLALSATNLANTAITFTANSLPSGLSISGNTITGTLIDSVNPSTSVLTATANSTARFANSTIFWSFFAKDIYFPYTTLLLKTAANVANGVSTTFSSLPTANNFGALRVGTAPITTGLEGPTVTPYGYKSAYFSGNVSYRNSVSITQTTSPLGAWNGSAFSMGTSAFSVQCFIYSLGTTGFDQHFADGGVGGLSLHLLASTRNLAVYDRVASAYIFSSSGYAIPLATWTHVSFTYDAGSCALYINGSQVATASVASSWTNTAFNIGSRYTSDANGWYPFYGYISNFRVPIGTNSAVPTTPYAAGTGAILTCNHYYFFPTTSATVPNHFVYGKPEISSFYPTQFTAKTANVSTAVSLNGSSYIEVPYSTAFLQRLDTSTGGVNGRRDLIVEFFIYPFVSGHTTTNTGLISFKKSDGTIGWKLEYDGTTNKIKGFRNAGSTDASSSVSNLIDNQWNHIAFVFTMFAGQPTNINVFVNGVGGNMTLQFPAGYIADPTPASLLIGTTNTRNANVTALISDVRLSGNTYYYGMNGNDDFFAPEYPLTQNANTRILLNFNDANYSLTTNTAQNNYFTDSSLSAAAITRNGTPTQGGFTPYKPDGYWSAYFSDGTNYATIPNSSELDLTTGDFTVECWFNTPALRSPNPLIYRFNGNSNSFTDLQFAIGLDNANIGATVYYGGAPNTVASVVGLVTAGVWHHCALVRTGNNFYFYLNGTRYGSLSSASALSTGSWSTYFGFWRGGSVSYPAIVYLSNVRIVKGTALYTNATETVPTSPLTTVTNTKFLGFQSNRFKDNSSNNFTISPTGTGIPSIQSSQPFSLANPYSPTTYGGSGYFNGSTDYLSLADNAALQLSSGDFTIEGWFYISGATSTAYNLISKGTATTGWSLNTTTGARIQFSYTASNLTGATTTLVANAWYHIAVVRSGSASGNLKIYLNGVQEVASAGSVNDDFNQTSTMYISASRTATVPLNGYLSNIRVVKGTAIYTAAFTPPALPVTAVSGTSLLTNFTNAGIYDAAWQNNALTVGDAQASTTQYKWSPTSMKYDGTGDWLTAIDSPGLQLGSGDFTIEGWFYLSATGAIYGIVSKGTATTGWSVNVTVLNKLQFSYTASNLTGATSLSASTWYYFAVVRSGTATGNLKVYLNGTADATSGGAVTDNFNQTSTFYTGADRIGGSALNGYLQDIRLTKGYARTVTTTPTAAFPTR
jgi:hypothetical protein